MKNPSFCLLTFLMTALTLVGTGDASANGQPHLWQMGMQDPASPVADRMFEFHDLLLIIIALISAFVFALLIYVTLRFNAKANPQPKIFSHNTVIEVIWTVVPVIILIIIAVPSIKLLYYQDRTAEPEMTLKVTGYQWYWGYEYPDFDGLAFSSYMLPADEIDEDAGQVRLLSTDKPVVLPVDTNIQILVTAADVLHAFAIPAFGIKIDAVPGRVNETWVRITEPGTYYGQCSELCGKDHSFMPIEIKAVSKEDFQRWLKTAREEFASLDTPPVEYASIKYSDQKDFR